ncbi:hypothetical protein HXX76_005341 [Chlamydomonas incerta]|uniref:3-hydroxybutyryl-CoA dehydrogenase n=1 Tax=Chlamydomonas incerta TaxID=51695 RepID=A0A835TJC8_CHLIN|nr:hypothetical protein HXX76_005341 [Chlamydomonas incerta]|eukprot:KAG2438800.1 hypothetical protein HXX76_005341 [Chlamydomonas incerta]
MLPNTVGVIGGGQMGWGIAQVIASRGMNVLLNDTNPLALERGLGQLKKALERLVKKGSMQPDDAAATLGRIQTSHDGLESIRAADFVIEAVAEDEALKKEVFRKLDRATRVETILASNTSSISITRLASATSKPHRVVGMHFMHPAPVVPLVELAKGMHTSQQTYEAARSLAESLGKSVCVSQDRPGFLVYRLLMPLVNEAFFLLSENVGSAEDIDRSMRLGTNMQLGPLRMADNIGLDTCLNIMRTLHSQFADSKYRPCPLLVQYVDAGLLGAKSGRGVFQHDAAIGGDKPHASQPHLNLTMMPNNKMPNNQFHQHN